MRTEVETRFMRGYKTSEVFDLLADTFGMSAVCNNPTDFEQAIYSRGFMNAIDSGLVPVSLELIPSFKTKSSAEYHHIIVDGECYVMYF